MITNILIYAQGEGTRFPGKHFKTIRGVPILERTVDILRGYTDQVTVIGPDTENYQRLDCALYTQPDAGKGLLDGIFNTFHLWKYGSIILLGDVVYSRQLIETMLTGARPFIMYGRTSANPFIGKSHTERFGLKVCAPQAEYLYNKLDWIYRSVNDGRLWRLYNRCQGVMDWHECEDWTDDVDTLDDLTLMRNYCEHLTDF